MKGRKGSTDEGGVRSPLFFKWPAKIEAGKQVNSISSVTDLLPTLASMAGIEYTPAKPLDGLDISSALLGDYAQVPDRMIFTHWRDKISVRTQRFRLDNLGELYDLEADPWEFDNLWDDPVSQPLKHKLIYESYDAHVLLTTDVGSRRIAPM